MTEARCFVATQQNLPTRINLEGAAPIGDGAGERAADVIMS